MEQLKDFPLPLTVRFEDQIIDFKTYCLNRSKSNLPDFASFAGKTGTLFLGKTRIAGVTLTADKTGASLTMEKNSIDFSKENIEAVILDTEVSIVAVMGTKEMSVDDILRLGNNSIVGFDKLAGEPIDLYVDDPWCFFGYGEALNIDGHFGVRIIQVTQDGLVALPKKRTSMDVPVVGCRFVLGYKSVTIKSLLELGESHILEFEERAEQPSKLIFDNGLTLDAEILVVGENFMARIKGKPEPLAEINETVSAASGEGKGDSSLDPVSFLRTVAVFDLLNLIQMEHPQIIALVLSGIEVEKAAVILQYLPSEIKSDVARRIATMDRTNPKILREIALILKQKISLLSGEVYGASGGIASIVKMLNLADRSTEKEIIEALENEDPELSEEIKKRMFTLEDIVSLQDTDVAKVLRAADSTMLATALESIDSDVRDKIFRCLPERSIAVLKEKMEKSPSSGFSEIETARREIVALIRTLEERGEITVGGMKG